MADFVGTENAIPMQRRLYDARAEIARDPTLVNFGRILGVLDPAHIGWEHVCEMAEQDGMIAFPIADKRATSAQIHTHLGADWTIQSWRTFSGTPDQVLPACTKVTTSVPLPDGCRVTYEERPDETEVNAVQDLNSRTGVSPNPAYFMRSDMFGVLSACMWDANNALVATASAADCYHPDSHVAGYIFAGLVSVAENSRGRGLGKLVNALVLSESHKRFGWRCATELAAEDNPVSQAMITSCGLGLSAGLWALVAMRQGDSFTR